VAESLVQQRDLPETSNKPGQSKNAPNVLVVTQSLQEVNPRDVCVSYLGADDWPSPGTADSVASLLSAASTELCHGIEEVAAERRPRVTRGERLPGLAGGDAHHRRRAAAARLSLPTGRRAPRPHQPRRQRGKVRRPRAPLSRMAGHIVIAIDDDGPGIPEDEIENVFRPFYCVDQSRSRDTGGSGLGLSVARAVFRAHGGDAGGRAAGDGDAAKAGVAGAPPKWEE
jgi:hypothetical protein